jgi:hypothetical protein
MFVNDCFVNDHRRDVTGVYERLKRGLRGIEEED